MRFVSYQDRKKIATSMRTIYTAPSVEAAELALKDLDQQWGRQYPGVIDVWRRAWNEFIPFLDYPPELRRVVYTTNADRIHQLPAPENHQDSRTFPVRRGRDEAALPRSAQHLEQQRR